MTTLYKFVQLTFENGIVYSAECQTPMSMEDIRFYLPYNSELVDVLTIDTEDHVMRQDLRGIKQINDYAGTRLEKLFEFQRTMLPPKIVKPVKVQVEIIDEQPKLPCDTSRDD